jgi:hypothetical protein
MLATAVEYERITRRDGRYVMVDPSITLDRFGWDEETAEGMTYTRLPDSNREILYARRFLLVASALVSSLGKRGLHETLRKVLQEGQNPPPSVLFSHLNKHSLINSLEVKICESTGLHADASSALPYEISPVLSESLLEILEEEEISGLCWHRTSSGREPKTRASSAQ